MERALALDELVAALGQHPSAPDATELAHLLAEAELSLLTGPAEVSSGLVQTGWYLHAVASAAGAGIDWERRAKAFRIGAHILELAASSHSRSTAERLQLVFGAELGYRRGGLDPNASAVYGQFRNWLDELASENPGWRSTLALEASVVFLSLNTSQIYEWSNTHRAAFAALRARTGLEDLAGTMFGPAEHVLEACRDFLRFLMFGARESLERGRSRLQRLFGDDPEAATVDERWIAAHMLVYSDELDAGSPWTCLPAEVPDAAKRALTHTSPPVLTLWEPQRELLAPDDENSHLLSPDTHRAILSIPTSAGKTLIAQILVLAELARSDRSVCLVAPQRSLVREIRRALIPRVRALQKRLSPEAPDFLADFAADILQGDQPPDIELLTPERFATMLRADAEHVLDRFGLFIFDEAHLIGDSARGFTLEGALSYLHWRTLDTDHRIVLMSAVIGDDTAFESWLEADRPLRAFRSLWRGPRRLSAAFTTEPDREQADDQPPSGRRTVHRVAYPLYGTIALDAPGIGPRTIPIDDPVGTLVLRKNRGGWDTRDQASTPHYRHVAALGTFLEHAGPVLTITLTRVDAQRLAGALAQGRPAVSGMRRATDAVARILDESHPLVEVLKRGVAYHHAGLPTDVLALIEDELRAGNIRQLVSTTTLTEGVNLPVHTVILAETRWQGNALHIAGPRMLNAIGRAGRAGIETEGWVVFAPSGRAPSDPGAHLPDPDELIIHSALNSDDVLDALAEFEAQQRPASDAVFSDLPERLQEFTSFVWYLLACEEGLGADVDDERLEEVISSLFVAQELADNDFERLLGFAHDVHDTYDDTDGSRRRAWARAGTTIASAQKIDEMAETLAAAVVERTGIAPGATSLADLLRAEEALADLGTAVDLFEDTGLLDEILDLPEVEDGTWEFRTSPRGAYVEAGLADAIRRWTAGAPIAEIADETLPDVPDRTFRIEQMVDAISRGFGHSISWMIAAVLERANSLLATRASPPVCPALPLYVRFGVDSAAGLQLVTTQVRNRRVAVLVARAAAEAEIGDDEIRDWLATVPVERWRTLFEAGPSDVLDLLNFASDTNAAILRSLIEGNDIDLPLDRRATSGPASMIVRRDDEGVPLVWVTTTDGDDFALGSQWQADLQNLLATGLEFSARITDSPSLLLSRAES